MSEMNETPRQAAGRAGEIRYGIKNAGWKQTFVKRSQNNTKNQYNKKKEREYHSFLFFIRKSFKKIQYRRVYLTKLNFSPSLPTKGSGVYLPVIALIRPIIQSTNAKI